MNKRAIKDGKPLASEHQLQSAFVQWARAKEGKYPELRLAFAVPNAAKRSFALAQIMRDEGLRAGVPDWWLPVPRKGFSGLVIEFKAPGKKVTDAQASYMEMLLIEGWRVYTMNDWAMAAIVVETYLQPL